jgi:hypothetical protein
LTFKKKEELDSHSQDCRVIENNGDAALPETPQRRITPEMQAKLKKRTKEGKHPSEEDKWFDIYDLPFPGSPHPVSGACKLLFALNFEAFFQGSRRLIVVKCRPRRLPYGLTYH